MAKFNVETRVTVPDDIEVKLVREDFYEISNIFRTLFEVSLSLTSALVGTMLSLDSVSNKYYYALIISIGGTVTFFLLTRKFKVKAYSKAKENK